MERCKFRQGYPSVCSDGPVGGGEVEIGIPLVPGLGGSDQKGGIRAAPLLVLPENVMGNLPSRQGQSVWSHLLIGPHVTDNSCMVQENSPESHWSLSVKLGPHSWAKKRMLCRVFLLELLIRLTFLMWHLKDRKPSTG